MFLETLTFNPDSPLLFCPVNDGVMGGVSTGFVRVTPQATLEFAGCISLENRGGFASIRSTSSLFDLYRAGALSIRYKGDGRTYSVNLYIDRPIRAFSYRAPLHTENGEWNETTLQLNAFQPTAFGQILANFDSFDPKEFRALGFMLSDKSAGNFRLEVERIGVCLR